MTQAAQKNEDLIRNPAPTVRAVAVPKPKAEPEMSIMYRVRDKLAYAGPRTHELYDSRGILQKFTFKDDQTWIEMAMPLAAKLIPIDGFEVQNERGYVMRAEQITPDSAKQGVILAFDEVVAKYDELTRDALQYRANKLGGSFKGNSPKEEMISFLIEKALTGSTLPDLDAEEDLEIEETEEFN